MTVSGDARHGLGAKPPTRSLSPLIVKHTGQEPGDELCEIFKFWLFLQSKSVNNVCKLLQPPQPHYWTPVGDFRPHTHWAVAPQMKLPGTDIDYSLRMRYCKHLFAVLNFWTISMCIKQVLKTTFTYNWFTQLKTPTKCDILNEYKTYLRIFCAFSRIKTAINWCSQIASVPIVIVNIFSLYTN